MFRCNNAEFDDDNPFEFSSMMLTMPTIVTNDSNNSDLDKQNNSGYFRDTRYRIHETKMSVLQHKCQLDIDNLPQYERVTSIVCTLGPPTESVETIMALIEHGMTIARVNLTLGSYKYSSTLIRNVREAESRLGGIDQPTIAVMVDITSPTVRTGSIDNKPEGTLNLKEGDTINLTTSQQYRTNCTTEYLYIEDDHFKNILSAINVGDRIDIDDGAIILIAREKYDPHTLSYSIRCLVEQGGVLQSSRVCRLTRSSLYRHYVAEKYKQDLLFAVENQVDIIGCGYAESSNAIHQIRGVLGPFGQNIKIVARIESVDGVKNISDILTAADAILIDRGELGRNLPLQKVFLAQKQVIAYANGAKKPVMVASQMLDSMRYKPRATRAEISDIANAVLDGTDCLVLGVETARGHYPLDSILCMHNVCKEAESAFNHGKQFNELKKFELRKGVDQIETQEVYGSATAAVSAAMKCGAAAIIVVTTTGRTAFAVASYRPPCPILTVTRQVAVARQCQLYRGIRPVYFQEEKSDDWSEDMDRRITYAMAYGIRHKFLKANEIVIICTGWHLGPTNTVRVVMVPHESELSTPMHIVRSSQVFFKAKSSDSGFLTASGVGFGL